MVSTLKGVHRNISNMARGAVTFVCIWVFVPYIAMAQENECGTRFTDPASSTVLAHVVLEGSVMEMSHDRPAANAMVSVKNIYKGQDILNGRGLMSSNHTVLITPFGEEDKDNCVASAITIPTGSHHVFFLRQTSQRGMLRLSALPLPTQDEVERRVKRSLCDTCVRPPYIEEISCRDCALEPSIKEMRNRKVRAGRRARIRCQVNGNPIPTISWYKGDVRVTEEGFDGVQVQEARKSSTLVFSSSTTDSGGQYRCVATNELGQAVKVITLEVVQRRPRPPRPPRPSSSPSANNRRHPAPLPRADNSTQNEECRCFNGGSCVISADTRLPVCRCVEGFTGGRCELITNREIVNLPISKPSNTSFTQTNQTLPINVPDNNTQYSEGTTTLPDTQTVESSFSRTDFSSSIHLSTTSPILMDIDNSATSSNPDESKSKESSTSSTMKPQNHHNQEATTSSPSTNTYTPSLSSADYQKAAVEASNPSSQSNIDASRITSVNTKTSNIDRLYTPKANGGDLVWLKTRRKKSKYCKDKKYCLNGGRCKIERKTGIKFCECRGDFTGERCELKT